MRKSTANIKRSLRNVITDAINRLGAVLFGRTPIGNPSLWKFPAPPGYEPGRLINNYFSSLGSPMPGIRRAQDVNAGGSKSQLKAVAKLAPGNVMFIMNPTPYAKRIEFAGWSTQAPAGMVRLSAALFPRFIKAAARVN